MFFCFCFQVYFLLSLQYYCSRNSIDSGESAECYKKKRLGTASCFHQLTITLGSCYAPPCFFHFLLTAKQPGTLHPLKGIFKLKNYHCILLFRSFCGNSLIIRRNKMTAVLPSLRYLPPAPWHRYNKFQSIFFFIWGLLRHSKGLGNLLSYTSGFPRMPCSPKFTD